MKSTQVLLRVGQAILVLLAAFTLAFILLTALPGDAVTTRYSNPELGLSEAEVSQIRESYGLDQPLIIQYFMTLTNFLTGNFGYSVNSGTAVSNLMKSALPGTLTLAFLAFAASIAVAFCIAFASTLPGLGWAGSGARSEHFRLS